MPEVWGIAYPAGAITKEHREEIGYYREWSTRKLAGNLIDFLTKRNIPHIIKVYRNSTDTKAMTDDLFRVTSQTRKIIGPVIEVFVIPDDESDPPETKYHLGARGVFKLHRGK